MKHLRQSIHPGVKGALFYGAYWGVVGMFEAFLTVHFLRLGFSSSQIGWLAAIFPLFNFLITPPLTRLADRTARRVLFLAAACALYGLGLVLLSIPSTFWALLPVFALGMAARAPVVPLADSLVARMAERRQLDFGAMRLWGSIIFTITSVTLGALWQQTGFQTMFILSGVCFALVVAAALLLEEPQNPSYSVFATGDDYTRDDEPAPTPARAIPEAGILFLLGANFLVVAALFMVGIFGTVYMTSIGGTEMHVGALFGLSALGEVPGMLFGKRLARRLGDTNTLLCAFVLIAAGFLSFAFARQPEALIVAGVVRGLGFGVFLVSTVTIINHRAPENMFATYQGMLNSLCWGLAPLLGGPTGGFIFEQFGPANLFILTAVMVVLAGVLLLPTYRLWRKGAPPALLTGGSCS